MEANNDGIKCHFLASIQLWALWLSNGLPDGHIQCAICECVTLPPASSKWIHHSLVKCQKTAVDMIRQKYCFQFLGTFHVPLWLLNSFQWREQKLNWMEVFKWCLNKMSGTYLALLQSILWRNHHHCHHLMAWSESTWFSNLGTSYSREPGRCTD